MNKQGEGINFPSRKTSNKLCRYSLLQEVELNPSTLTVGYA